VATEGYAAYRNNHRDKLEEYMDNFLSRRFGPI
jgi:hypothetical protein